MLTNEALIPTVLLVKEAKTVENGTLQTTHIQATANSLDLFSDVFRKTADDDSQHYAWVTGHTKIPLSGFYLCSAYQQQHSRSLFQFKISIFSPGKGKMVSHCLFD